MANELIVTREQVSYIRQFFTDRPYELYLLHFTHDGDADGVACGALSRLLNEETMYVETFDLPHKEMEVKVVYVGYHNMEEVILSELREFDFIMGDDKRVLITDLTYNDTIARELKERNINFLWIDHHIVPKPFDEIIAKDPAFFIYNDTYDRCIVDLIYKTMDTDNRDGWDDELYFLVPEYSTTGTIKLAGIALYALCVYIGIENPVLSYWMVKYISDSDTYWFKYATEKVRSWWPTVEEEDKELLDERLHGIPDVAPLIFKHQGMDMCEWVFGFLLIDNWKPMLEEDVIGIAKKDHVKRVEEYEKFKETLVPMEITTQGNSVKNGVFSTHPATELSMFSNWLFEETEYDFVMNISSPYWRTIAMRSREGVFDIAEFCNKYFSGGGHKEAAGGNMPKHTMKQLLESYWVLSENDFNGKLCIICINNTVTVKEEILD